MVKIQLSDNRVKNQAFAHLLFETPKPLFRRLGLSQRQLALAKYYKANAKSVIGFYEGKKDVIVQFIDPTKEKHIALEDARKAGYKLYNELKTNNIATVQLSCEKNNRDFVLAFAEGLALSTYQFEKYKKEKSKYSLKAIYINRVRLKTGDVENLAFKIEAMEAVKDLVNEPVSFLTAEVFSNEIKRLGKEAGFKVEVLNKAKIEALKMGGLLAVNKGSVDPPTFNILEHNPPRRRNKKTYILVGKGVVYDTGGLSLKPTAGSMDTMKCDMAGGAVVTGIMYAAAKMNLPIHLIGLIPATDNRPSGNAVTPGDVITISDGTTVEVLNTDAEGRLILADALHYAKKYKPDLVIDFATLTGAAARAIGEKGIVFMGTALDDHKSQFVESGKDVYERLVEFPLWDEYGEMLKSDIADMKNISGGTMAGAITAGKFLEHFTNYPWLHFDIAGPAFISTTDSYRGKNATAVGVRLVLDFINKELSRKRKVRTGKRGRPRLKK
ncbi:MAG: leucyl aminopeptidase family protein [Bacteroidetes bacterium]|nr:leucyl aminopeptidase family protein [Bacteroidota bacterium]